MPYWVNDCQEGTEADEISESEKLLWGRQDDESCIEENQDKMNSSMLAKHCGTFSR